MDVCIMCRCVVIGVYIIPMVRGRKRKRKV